MNRVSLLLAVLAWIFYSDPAQAQVAITSNAEFRIDVDVAQFYGDSTQVYLELYYGIGENILSYVRDSGRYSGKALLRLLILKDSITVSSKEWLVSHEIEDSVNSIRPKTLYGLQTVDLPPGDYQLTMICKDVLDSSRKTTVILPLCITGYPSDKECLSDIEFCTSIKTSVNEQSLFYKNTLEVIPNPSRLYGTGLPIMYYYTTVYNLLADKTTDSVIVRASVMDAAGREILVKDKNKPRLYNASVEVGTFNLSVLRSGSYLFRVSLVDTLKNIIAKTEKKFFVYKHGSMPDTSITYSEAIYSGSRYGIMHEQDIDRAFDYVHYIASVPEREQYSNLTDLKAKQKFLFDFWQRRDTDNQPMINEKEDDYFKCVDYANDQYGSGFREGWKTDRGRVYIIYGHYDEIERFQSTGESNPYEIWRYHNIQGGVEFVFVDKEGLGNYVLVHSTHRNELHDTDWYKRYAQKMR